MKSMFNTHDGIFGKADAAAEHEQPTTEKQITVILPDATPNLSARFVVIPGYERYTGETPESMKNAIVAQMKQDVHLQSNVGWLTGSLSDSDCGIKSSSLSGAVKRANSDFYGITVRQHIQDKIAGLESNLNQLKEKEKRLEAAGVLDLPFDLFRDLY
jgi:hypothetical protein